MKEPIKDLLVRVSSDPEDKEALKALTQALVREGYVEPLDDREKRQLRADLLEKRRELKQAQHDLYLSQEALKELRRQLGPQRAIPTTAVATTPSIVSIGVDDVTSTPSVMIPITATASTPDPDYHAFKVGDPKRWYGRRVKTGSFRLLRSNHYQYNEEAIPNRRPHIEGVVTDHHTGHGLCYQVRHDDGSHGWYEPEELTALPMS